MNKDSLTHNVRQSTGWSRKGAPEDAGAALTEYRTGVHHVCRRSRAEARGEQHNDAVSG